MIRMVLHHALTLLRQPFDRYITPLWFQGILLKPARDLVNRANLLLTVEKLLYWYW